ncbi:hypothetical protein TorRG33x02_037710, partial [Trema orientale]
SDDEVEYEALIIGLKLTQEMKLEIIEAFKISGSLSFLLRKLSTMFEFIIFDLDEIVTRFKPRQDLFSIIKLSIFELHYIRALTYSSSL